MGQAVSSHHAHTRYQDSFPLGDECSGGITQEGRCGAAGREAVPREGWLMRKMRKTRQPWGKSEEGRRAAPRQVKACSRSMGVCKKLRGGGSCRWSEMCEGKWLRRAKSGKLGDQEREGSQRAWQDPGRTFGSNWRVLSRVT